jgi:hypothetical protein
MNVPPRTDRKYPTFMDMTANMLQAPVSSCRPVSPTHSKIGGEKELTEDIQPPQ